MGNTQLIRNASYPVISYLHTVTLLLSKPDFFFKKFFTTLFLSIHCTGRGVHSDWKFIYSTKHKVVSVKSHQQR